MVKKDYRVIHPIHILQGEREHVLVLLRERLVALSSAAHQDQQSFWNTRNYARFAEALDLASEAFIAYSNSNSKMFGATVVGVEAVESLPNAHRGLLSTVSDFNQRRLTRLCL